MTALGVALSAAESQSLAQVMGVLASELDADSLRERLTKPLAELLNADQVSSFVWNSTESKFGRGVTWGLSAPLLRLYENDLQYVDPIADKLRTRRGPIKVSEVFPAKELIRMPFFERFLSSAGLHWGVNLFASNGQTEVGDLRIWRRHNRLDFGAKEMALLSLLRPAIEAAFSRGSTSNLSMSQPPSARPTFLTVTGLSPKEMEIALLVVQGASDKKIAQATNIAVTTVRTHLSHIFHKTNTKDRRQLMRRCV